MLILPHLITYALGFTALILISRNINFIYKKVRIAGHIKFLMITGLILQVVSILSFFHNHYNTWFIENYSGGELRDLVWIFNHYTTMLFHIVVSCALGAHLEFRRWRKRSGDI